MRITLSIDDDVAAGLAAMRKGRNQRLAAVVNEALRIGLHEMRRQQLRPRFRTGSADLGRWLVRLEDVADALDADDAESYR